MKDKVVIITGASSGIGKSLAHELGKAGAKLALAGRNEEALQEVSSHYPDLLVVPTDVTDEAQCKALVEKTVAHFGGIDVLVNNAGITMQTFFDDIQDLSLFHKIMDVNYFGTVYCTFYALPHIKIAKGLVVGISSVSGKVGVPTRTAYCGSKHAMEGFLRSLRIELMETGVDVTVVSPGYVQSEIRKRALGADAKPAGKSKIDESKIMTAEDCAREIHEAMQERKRDLIVAINPEIKQVLEKLLIPKAIDEFAYQAIKSGKS